MKLSNVPLKKNKKNYSFNGTKKEKKKKKITFKYAVNLS